jgi:NAD-dependent SIR2 family protein deacetylase
MEGWIDGASVIVFIGTSSAVTLTQKALDHARKENKAVYNFNIDGESLECTSWMNVENVIGDVQRTLPELVRFCEEEFGAKCK